MRFWTLRLIPPNVNIIFIICTIFIIINYLICIFYIFFILMIIIVKCFISYIFS